MTAFAQRLREVAGQTARRHLIGQSIADAVLVVVLRELAAEAPWQGSTLQFLSNEIEESGA